MSGLRLPKYVWVIFLFSLLWGYFLYESTGVRRTPFYTPDWSGQWIRFQGPDTPRSYFRKEFYLTDNVAHAWVQISADNDYILYLNGDRVGWEENLLSNTSPCQEAQSERGQKIGRQIPFPIRNPPEAQWRSPRDWTIATFYDITSLLKVGKNVLGVAVQTDRSSARFVLDGEVEDILGETYPLSSDSTWKASSLPETELGLPWHQLEFTDTRWTYALPVDGPRGKIVTRLDPEMYRRPLAGEWIWNPLAPGIDSYFRKRFVVDSEIEDAWIRIAADGSYDLFINGVLAARAGVDHPVFMYSVGPLLRRGPNTIAVHARGAEEHVSSAGARSAPSELLLDGLVRTKEGTALTIATDASWETSQSVKYGWTQQKERGSFESFAASRGKPSLDFLETVTKKYAGSALTGMGYYKRLAMYWLICLGGFLLVWLAFSAYLSRRAEVGILEAMKAAVICYWIPIVLMACVLLLKFRFGVNHHKILFYTPALWQTVTVVSILAMLLFKAYLVFGTRIGRQAKPSRIDRSTIGPSNPGVITDLWTFILDHRYGVMLALIMLMGAYLRLKGLGTEGYHSDESSSLTPIMGIIKTGLPEYPSGVYYTRGPAYHYLAAVFIKVLGLTRFTGRLSSALFGILTIPLLYRYGERFLGDRKAPLLAAFLLAVSPWAIFMGRSLRFYQQFQFFGLLCAYLFIKGFVVDTNRRYQYLALGAFTLTFLSQEVGVTLIAAFFLSYLFFAPRTSWREKFPVIAGLFIVGALVITNIMIFMLVCLTPPVAISPTSMSVVTPHIYRIYELALTMFVGYNRLHVILSFFFLLGLPLYFLKKDKIVLFTYGLVLVTIAAVTVAVLQIGLRYISEIYTFYSLLACVSIFGIIREISAFHRDGGAPLPSVLRAVPFLQKSMLGIIVGTLLISFQPMRIIQSYSSRINRGDTFAQEFVKQHMFPTDIVIAGHHPGAVANITGKVDYYLLQKGLADEIFKKEGIMIDRRGGATIVDSIDKLRTVFNENERAWIIISDLRLKAFDADLVDFITKNTKVVYQPFLCTVFLWDAGNGVYDAPQHLGYERYYFD
ncbi:MAG: glycosyltransferase family 39 protein [Candidatus Eisenbacteria bacterium]